MTLVGCNKQFMDLAVGAADSTHDDRFFRHTGLFQKKMAGQGLPNKSLGLEYYRGIPLVTVSDSSFLRFSWLVKGLNGNTSDKTERNYNMNLNNARVMTECPGYTHKQIEDIIHKTEMKMYNWKNIITTCVMLHNISIHTNDPCNPL